MSTLTAVSEAAPGAPTTTIRLAAERDAAEIAEIYNRAVTESTATFDLRERSLDEQRTWLNARSGAFAAIVAEDSASGRVIGFASLSPY